MNLSTLYNIDESRTEKYTQKIVIPESLKLYLDHVPLKDSLTIVQDPDSANSPYVYLDVVTSGAPLPGQAYIEYRGEYDYVMARGLVIFNAANVGESYVVEYIPVASRVDADPINELIRFGNQYDEHLWTKEELITVQRTTAEISDKVTPEINKGIIIWENIKNRPGAVMNGTGAAGLMTPADKNKLDGIEHPTYIHPIGSLKVGSKYTRYSTYVQSYVDMINKGVAAGKTLAVATSDANTAYPNAATQLAKYRTPVKEQWGGYVELTSTDTVTPNIKNDGTIEFHVNKDQVMSDIAAFKDALRGSTDVDAHKFNIDFTGKLTDNMYMNPSSDNRYVTEADYRLYNSRTPTAHTHTSLEILGTDTLEFMKENGGSYSDGTMMFPEPSNNLREDLARRAYKYHRHSLTDISGLDILLDASGTLDLVNLRGKDGGYYTPIVSYTSDGLKLGFSRSATDMPLIDSTWVIQNGVNGTAGEKGDAGGYYVPKVDANGNISWEAKGFSSDTTVEEIPVVNIKGPQGDSSGSGTSGDTISSSDIYANWTIDGIYASSSTSNSTYVTYSAGNVYLSGSQKQLEADDKVSISIAATSTISRAGVYVLYAVDTETALENNTNILDNLPLTFTINVTDVTSESITVTHTDVVYNSGETAYTTTTKTKVLTAEDPCIYTGINIDLYLYGMDKLTVGDTISIKFYKSTADTLVHVFDESLGIWTYSSTTALTPTQGRSLFTVNMYPLSCITLNSGKVQLESDGSTIKNLIDLQVRFPRLLNSANLSTSTLIPFKAADWNTSTNTLTINKALVIPTSCAYELKDTATGLWESKAVTVQFTDSYIKILATKPFTGAILATYL